MITSKSVQNNFFEKYVVGSCVASDFKKSDNNCDWNIYNGGIGIEDWKYKTTKCANNNNNIALCSKLNHTNCPKINGDVDTRWDHEKGAPNVLCNYPLHNFQKMEDINIYLNKWGEDDNYNKKIMPYFCSNIVKTCPENIDHNRFLSCSRFVSNGIDGKLCQKWAEQNSDLADEIIMSYCDKNKTEDCSCISEKLEYETNICGKSSCSKPSYLSTSMIKEKVESCKNITNTNININADTIPANKFSWKKIVSGAVFILLLFVLIITLYLSR